MGFLQRLSSLFRAETRSATVGGDACATSPGGFWDSVWGLDTQSGVKVSRKTVIGVPAVWRAVNLLGGAMASVPFDLFERTASGSQEANTHPLSVLFAYEPHPYYSTFDFIKTLVGNAALGNGYAWIERDPETARPIHLHLLDPEATHAYMSADGILIYHSALWGRSLMLFPDEIIHLKAVTFDGIFGEKVAVAHKEGLGMGIAATLYGASFFGNGAVPSGVVEMPGKLTDEARERLRKGWFSKFGGTSKVGNVAVLDDGAKFQKISLDPQSAMLIEARKFTVEEVGRIFGVPPHLLYELERATFNSVEMLSTSFVSFTLLHWARQIEQEFNRKLLFETEKAEGRYFFRFNLDGLLRGDTAARATLYSTMFNVGALSSNDIRRLENLNDRPGGDEYFVSLALKGNETPVTTTPAKGGKASNKNGESQTDEAQPNAAK